MDTESNSYVEDNIKNKKATAAKYLFGIRDFLLALRLRRNICNDFGSDEELYRKYLLDYNRNLLLYIGPFLYLAFFISKII